MDEDEETVLKKFRKSDLELVSDILDKDIFDTGKLYEEENSESNVWFKRIEGSEKNDKSIVNKN